MKRGIRIGLKQLIETGLSRKIALFALVNIASVLIIVTYWTKANADRTEIELIKTLGSTLDHWIESGDLTSINKVLGAFGSAYKDSTICVRTGPNQIIRRGDGECVEYLSFETPLRHSQFSVAVHLSPKFPVPELVFFLVVVVVLGTIFITLYMRKIGRKVLYDLEVLGSDQDRMPRFFSELHETKKSLNRQRNELVEATQYKAIAQTTQMIAHDVRTPFTLLSMLLSQLREVDSIEAMKKIVSDGGKHLERNLKHVNSMLTDIVDVGSSNKTMLSSFDAIEAMNQIIEDVRCFENSYASVDIACDYQHSNFVSGEASKVQRVFKNLFDNAIEAAGKDGRIWISSRDINISDRTWIQFSIRNSGRLIAETDLPLVFEAFFTKGKSNGTGLGLAITKKIVKSYGGDIWCESTPDKGTEFIFTVPAIEAIKRQTMPAPMLVPKVTPKVVLVEDDPFLTEAWMRLFKKNEILCVTNPQEFWHCLDNKQMELCKLEYVICDYFFENSGNVTGEDLAKDIRKRTPHLKVFLSSNQVINSDVFDAVLPKDPKLASEEIRRLSEPSNSYFYA